MLPAPSIALLELCCPYQLPLVSTKARPSHHSCLSCVWTQSLRTCKGLIHHGHSMPLMSSSPAKGGRHAWTTMACKLNIKKTEHLRCGPQIDISVNGEELKRALDEYLGSVITSDGSTLSDAKARVNVAWMKWCQLTGILHDHWILQCGLGLTRLDHITDKDVSWVLSQIRRRCAKCDYSGTKQQGFSGQKGAVPKSPRMPIMRTTKDAVARSAEGRHEDRQCCQEDALDCAKGRKRCKKSRPRRRTGVTLGWRKWVAYLNCSGNVNSMTYFRGG